MEISPWQILRYMLTWSLVNIKSCWPVLHYYMYNSVQNAQLVQPIQPVQTCKTVHLQELVKNLTVTEQRQVE